MVNALEAGTIVAVMAGAVGWFMVLRRQTFAGHTLSVVAFPGAAAASLAGLPVALGYFGFCGLGALRSRSRSRAHAETARIGCDRTVQAFGLGLGFLFVSLYTESSATSSRCCSGRSSGSRRRRCALLWSRLAAMLVLAAAGGRFLRLGRRRRRPRHGAFRRRCSASASCSCSGSRLPRRRRSPARCSSSRCWSRPPRRRIS